MEVMPTPKSEPMGEDFQLATSDDLQRATNGDFDLAIDNPRPGFDRVLRVMSLTANANVNGIELAHRNSK
jgi:hypothetical protein